MRLHVSLNLAMDDGMGWPWVSRLMGVLRNLLLLGLTSRESVWGLGTGMGRGMVSGCQGTT